MIDRTVFALLAFICALSAPRAECAGAIPPEPPVRLKKKDLAAPPASKRDDITSKPADKPAKVEERPGTDQAAAMIEARVAKKMGESQKRLAAKDLDDATSFVQTEILKDLDQLMHQMKQRQQTPPTQSEKSSSKDLRPQKRQEQTAAERQQRTAAQSPGQGSGPPARTAGPANIKGVYKDVWGHLPETLRQEIDQYAREQFMAKYSELIQRYYSTIAEKGHRKGD